MSRPTEIRKTFKWIPFMRMRVAARPQSDLFQPKTKLKVSTFSEANKSDLLRNKEHEKQLTKNVRFECISSIKAGNGKNLRTGYWYLYYKQIKFFFYTNTI